MIVIVLLLVAVLTVPLAGGRLGALAQLPVRGTGLVMAAFGIQLLAISIFPSMDHRLAETIHLASYALAAAFCLLNLHIRWMSLTGFGGAMNALAVVANGGVMPASRWATRTAGMALTNGEFANSQILQHPRLLLFGDIMAIPARWPLANVFSIGDVVLVLGVTLLLHSACGSGRPVPSPVYGVEASVAHSWGTTQAQPAGEQRSTS